MLSFANSGALTNATSDEVYVYSGGTATQSQTLVLQNASGSQIMPLWSNLWPAGTPISSYTSINPVGTSNPNAEANIAMVYNTANQEFRIGYTHESGTETNINMDSYCDLHVHNIKVDGNVIGGTIASGSCQCTVTLNQNDGTTKGFIVNSLLGTSNRGSYVVLVTGYTFGGTVTDGLACATFAISKNLSTATAMSAYRLTSCTGTAGEELDFRWDVASTLPYLIHSTAAGTATAILYNLRVVYF
jgi:hypothetical protein